MTSAGHGLNASDVPLLTVIIPVYNEASTIGELLRRVVAAPYARQVIIVDDGSTDGTASVLDSWRSQPGVRIHTHTINRGKGRAIRTGIAHATGLFTIIQDADLEYDPQDYAKLIEPLRTGQAQVIYGSRYLGQPIGRRGGFVFRLGVAVLNAAVRLLYGARLTDEATCYKAMPTALLRLMDLRCEGFEFCPEVTAKACRMGLSIREVPISYNARSHGAGKKIRWRDGAAALRTLWRWRRWTCAAGETAVRAALAGTTQEALMAAGEGASVAPEMDPAPIAVV